MTKTNAINPHDSRFLKRALLLSIAAHALVAVIKVSQDHPVKEAVVALTVKLVPAKPVEPVAPAAPPTPEPIKPPPPPKPPVPVKQSTPSPVQAPPKVESASPVAPVVTEENSPVTAVITASEPKTEAPVKVAPVELSPTPPVDTQQERNQYGALLASEIAKHKQYPILAKRTRQQGNVILQVQITSLGKLIAAQVYQSSGYELLDSQAMEMVKKATPFSHPPSALGERDLTLLVPVSFRLN